MKKTGLSYDEQNCLIWSEGHNATNWDTKMFSVELLKDVDLGGFNPTWDKSRQSSFIKSLLMKMPTSIKTTKQGDGSIVIIDGRNRVFAIQQFLSNNLDFCDDVFMSGLNGLKYNGLSTSTKRGLLNHSIRTEHFSLASSVYVVKCC